VCCLSHLDFDLTPYESVDENMKRVLKDVQSGDFAREWIRENEEGLPQMTRYREEDAGLLVEKVGRQLREMMQSRSSSKEGGELSPSVSG